MFHFREVGVLEQVAPTLHRSSNDLSLGRHLGCRLLVRVPNEQEALFAKDLYPGVVAVVARAGAVHLAERTVPSRPAPPSVAAAATAV